MIKRISDSENDYSNFFVRKKILRTIRKVKTNIKDTIDHLSCISHPRAFYNNKQNDGYIGSWNAAKSYFMKKKFFKRPDHIEHYDFENLSNSLQDIISNLRELKIEIKK